MSRILSMLREAIATAFSQPIASLVSVMIVAGMCATVLLTAGRTVGAEQAVLGSIDSAGTRSIVVRAEPDAGLTTAVLSRLEQIDGIEWAGAFGPAEDVTNALIPDGTRVATRMAWSSNFDALGMPRTSPLTDRTAWASPLAIQRLGLLDRAGGTVSSSGVEYAIAGELKVPDFLRFMEPLVVVPQHSDHGENRVSVLVVIASRPDLVAPLADVVRSLLGAENSTQVNVATSESLAELRSIVQGQLGSFGRNLVLLVFGVAGALVAAILYGLVMLRRKDFGRRRALGASQGLIIALLLTQMAALSFAGAALGCAAAAIGLASTGDPLPDLDYFAAIAVLAVGVGVLAALLPAIAAAKRDPLSELRVP